MRKGIPEDFFRFPFRFPEAVKLSSEKGYNMNLKDLEQFNPITIQCHDNPDPDAIASGYGLYCYFREKGKDVRLVYSGRNAISKSNLLLMVEKLQIPITYIHPQEKTSFHVPGLLLTVDCQYGAGNVSGITGDFIAIIDHHQEEITNVSMSQIVPGLGSCSTLVWKMLREEGFSVDDAPGLGTALYYGLYCDTNQLSEIRNPLDKDLRDGIRYDNGLITMFRNCNLSLAELEVAGVAMIRHSYNSEYGFAVIKAQPCDPNILGLISDFLLQVDVVKTCIVYNETGDGYKISVRSCVKEVNASEMAAYLTEGIGSGGGHFEKAGGFISGKLFQQKFPGQHAEAYFNTRLIDYYNSFETIYASSYEADLTGMEMFRKRRYPIGYVKMDQVLPIGVPITVRSLEGDLDMRVDKDLYVLIGIKGEAYANREDKFLRGNEPTEDKYYLEKYAVSADYVPNVKNKLTGQTLILTDYAKVCYSTGQNRIYAKQLTSTVKVFTAWDPNRYLLGRPGDYLAVREDDLHDVYVIERDIFGKSYERCVSV